MENELYSKPKSIVVTCVYLRLIFTNFSNFDPLQVIIASLVALFIYQIPGQNYLNISFIYASSQEFSIPASRRKG